MADTAVTENPGRDRAQIPVAMTTRPVHAGTTKRLVKMSNDAASPAPFRETGTPGVITW